MRLSLLRAGLLACALSPALLVAGCTKPASQVVIGIITNLAVSDELDQVQMDIAREDVHLDTLVWQIQDHAANFTLPGSINVDADNGASPQVQLTVTGFKDNAQKVVRQSTLQLLAEQQLFYRMALVLSCEGDAAACPDGLHCVEGICSPDAVDATTFLPYAEGRTNAIECDSHTRYIDTSTCAADSPDCTAIPPDPNGCEDPNDFCSEGTCYKPNPEQPRQLEFGQRCTAGVDTCRLSSMFVCADTPNGTGDDNCRQICDTDQDCNQLNPGASKTIGNFVPSSCLAGTSGPSPAKVCTFPCNPLSTGSAGGCFNGRCALIDDGKNEIVPDCVSIAAGDGTVPVGGSCSSRTDCSNGSTCASEMTGGPMTCHQNCIVCQGQTGCPVSTTATCPTGKQCDGLFVVGADQMPVPDTTYGVCL